MYRYTYENKVISSDKSYRYEDLQNMNKANLTSIAYTWQDLATKQCPTENNPANFKSSNSYDKLLGNQNSPAKLKYKISESLRDCHSQVFLDNWSEIQKMITFHLNVGNSS